MGRPKGSKNKTPIPVLDTDKIQAGTLSGLKWDIWKLEPGDKMQYYSNGWRVGALVKLELSSAVIKPEGSGRNISVAHDCVRGLNG